MAQQVAKYWPGSVDHSARVVPVPRVMVQFAGALLALAVTAVHVADQGGLSSFASPGWLGWGYRLIEAGGVLTALVLLAPWSAWLGWAAGVLLGAGPFVGYLASRAVGLPGDHKDVGNWGHWLGTVSLVVEAALVVLSISMLRAHWQLARRKRSPSATGAPAIAPGSRQHSQR